MQESERHDQLLSDALRHLAVVDAGHGASPAVEARLLAEVRAIARSRRRAYVKVYVVAASLLIVVALPVWQVARREPLPAPSSQPEEVATEFFPLMYSDVPTMTRHVVRVEVPEAVMVSFGLYPVEAGPVDTVLADVLVGDDGLARAVRFVLTPQEETP